MNTPVVILFFNRPDLLKILLSHLEEVKPKKLYLVCDGPRSDREGEAEKVNECRTLFKTLSWPCEIHKNYSDINLGCRQRVVSGLNWVFENEEEAIILEDDCIPIPDFFPFCQSMLQKYEQTENIMSIGGFNFGSGLEFGHHAVFTKYPMIWGWATWRRAWESGCMGIAGISSLSLLLGVKSKLGSWRAAVYWTYVLKHVTSSWGYLWMYSHWVKNACQVISAKCLVSNVGLNVSASTHTGTHAYEVPAVIENFPPPYSTPETISPDRGLDRYVEDHIYSRSFAQRMKWLRSKFIKRNRHD